MRLIFLPKASESRPRTYVPTVMPASSPALMPPLRRDVSPSSWSATGMTKGMQRTPMVLLAVMRPKRRRKRTWKAPNPVFSRSSSISFSSCVSSSIRCSSSLDSSESPARERCSPPPSDSSLKSSFASDISRSTLLIHVLDSFCLYICTSRSHTNNNN